MDTHNFKIGEKRGRLTVAVISLFMLSTFLFLFSLSSVSADSFGYGRTENIPTNYSEIVINETSNMSLCWSTDEGVKCNVADISAGEITDTTTNRFVTDTQIGNWNTAYGWGDHSTEGYLINETDPTFDITLDNSLVGWWDMSDYDGSILYDKTGNNNLTNVNGTYVLDNGFRGKGLYSNSSQQFFNFTTFNNIPLGNKSRTLSVWVRSDEETINSYFGFSGAPLGGGAGNWFMINWENNAISLTFGGHRLSTTPQELEPGVWYHVIAMLPEGANDTDDLEIFINGINKTSELIIVGGSGYPHLLDTWAAGGIGGFTGQPTTFNGSIDDAMIFNRSLNTTEINQLFQLGLLDHQTNISKIYASEYISSKSGAFTYLNAIFGRITNATIGYLEAIDLKIMGGNLLGTLYLGSGSTYYINSGGSANFEYLQADYFSSYEASFYSLTYYTSDPETMGWIPTNRERIKAFAKDFMAYEGGTMDFFNNETQCYEVFVPSTGTFYKDRCLADMEVIETTDPIINENVVMKYRIDPLSGNVETYLQPTLNKTYQLTPEVEINETTGTFYKNINGTVIEFEEYEVGRYYEVGDLLVYKAEVYEVLQAHTSQTDWRPGSTPSLYKGKILDEFGEVGEWKQPTGASDCYALGALVLYQETVYKSLIDCNVWSPTAYPAGWETQ